jgi:L-2,4-diaminobutyric acid acetyltransferase
LENKNMSPNITIRPSKGGDSLILHELASHGAPYLLAHTPFTYWVMVFNYADYIFIAHEGEKPVGFIMAMPSADPAIGLFIWQIGIVPDHRGAGLGGRLIRALLEKHASTKRFTITVDPDNIPSFKAFKSAASALGTTLEEITNPASPADNILLSRDNERIYTARW